MNCELCGRPANLERFEIEGTIMNVCSNCQSHGKTKAQVERVERHKPILREESRQTIVENYSKLVKTAREQKGLKPKELAKQIAEKESILSQIESAKFKPSLKLASKLERALNIKLVEIVNTEVELEKKDSKPLTIGDMITIKKRTRK